MPTGVYVCKIKMARHIFCVLDRTVGPVSICWDYVSIFIKKIPITIKLTNLVPFQLQTPQSFSQSINELTMALQRTGDPGNLSRLKVHLELLSNVDPGSGQWK